MYNGKHIPEKKNTNIIGSPNFVSLNVHKGCEPSRRDDIQSCIYVILYMLVGRLEWFNNEGLEQIQDMKEKTVDSEDLPQFIKIMLHYAYDMKFEEEPDYNYLIDLMNKERLENGYSDRDKFEWD
jgi:casein kinase 1